YKDYELKTGNAIWVQKDYPILEEYKNIVENYYGAKAADVDFIKETEKSRQTINAFIEEQTNKKIKDLILPGAISEATRLVITNAIYFKGNWLYEFDPKKTREMDFRISYEKTVKVPMMYMRPEEKDFNYSDLGNLEILELPYKGDRISMLIILPKDDLKEIELTYENLEKWRSELKPTHLDGIYIPKFEFKTKYFMVETLKKMGMTNLFCDEDIVDLSGIKGTKNICVSNVIHQAYVKVDEKGTEAAAATAIIIIGETSISPYKIFRADHPFIFIIQERKTGNILFIGRVIDPTAE
ncbi:MAG: serpin family protein, partial [Candidatus Aenigmatarchaeota archaeon]